MACFVLVAVNGWSISGRAWVDLLLEDTLERERFSVGLPLFPFLCFLGLLIEQSRNFALLFIYFSFLVLYD